jgi:hypothetical protein
MRGVRPMGLFRKRRKETIEEITDRVLDKHGIGPAEPDRPGEASMFDPVLLREIAKEVKKAKDRGLLIESPPSASD